MNEAPRYLDDAGRELWPIVLAELQSIGRLTAANQRRAGRYCQLLAQWERMTRFLNTNGQVVEVRDAKGEVKGSSLAPEFSGQAELERALARFEKDFGFLEAPKADKAPPGRAASEGDALTAVRKRLAQLTTGQPSRN